MLTHYTCRHSLLIDFLLADRMIVKFCRANALIPWLTRVFDFTYAPIYLIRHPFAVVASQLKHPAWNPNFDGYRIPDCPYNEFYLRHADFLASLQDKYEELVSTWCLTNLVPLRNSRNNKSWITVYYENLLFNPEQELGRIFGRWGLPLPESILSRVTHPSSSTSDATFQQSREKQLSKWQNFFDKTEIERMMNVLS